ncbi:cytochrome P450 4c3-like [Onthophagus taurus]|uniref:cytochrome P450 4c3-like n=1 Tax=Onthophagus taurus TaxID=166361 RepID=UPI000C201ACE|nr:cytochrome P450 4c3-like [Onthophagus taurus]XP_022901354.1 cytochrome P450 4c3-like [Onthophagus taurus]
MFVLIVLLIALIVGIYFWYKNLKSKFRDLDKLPGPKEKFLTGNATDFGSDVHELFEASQQMVMKYGRLVRVWQGPFRLNLFVTDPDKVEYFLSSNVLIKKSTGYDLYKPWLGEGLINGTGEVWKKYRKILTPAFHLKILDQFSDVFHRNLQILIDNLKKESGKTVDICPILTLYAMDSLCETSMGINHKYQHHGDTSYMNAVHAFLEIYMSRFFSILNRFDIFFRFTKDHKILYDSVNLMHKITDEVIKKRKDFLQGVSQEEDVDDMGIKKKRVFLDTLLEHPGLTNEEMRWQVDTFLFAGHDTVASAMGFALYTLAKYPEVQQNILDEIHDFVGDDVNEEITLNNLKEMDYLERVIKEVLRLYPTVPLYEREMTEDISLDGLRIPKGTTISFHPYAQHRDPELFPCPERFDPDRFLPENISKRHPFAYIPFSAGPRNCIGMKYALMNIKTTVANVIRNFQLYPAEYPHTPKLGNDAVLKSMNGLPIKIIYRK